MWREVGAARARAASLPTPGRGPGGVPGDRHPPFKTASLCGYGLSSQVGGSRVGTVNSKGLLVSFEAKMTRGFAASEGESLCERCVICQGGCFLPGSFRNRRLE